MATMRDGAAGAALLAIAAAGWAGPAAAETGCGVEADPATPCRLVNGTYHALIPEGDGPFPVVVALHSSGETGADLVASEFYRTMLTGEGIALLAPNGAPQAYSDGSEAPGWHLRQTGTGGRDDISFIEAVLVDAARRFPIETGTALLTGHGLGGSMVWETACLAPDAAFAYAPRNGGFYTSLPETCRGPFRLMHVHGAVEGGWPLTEALEPEAGAAPQPVQPTLDMAGEALGCEGSAPQLVDLPEGHTLVAWAGCEPEAALQLLLHRSGSVTSAGTFGEILDWWAGERRDAALAESDGGEAEAQETDP